MIRRQISNDQYLLITQMEHARLAVDIAKLWNAPSLKDYSLLDDLLFAIEHHDDGWKDWESAPDLEPSLQLPRSFMEMETDVALTIAERSIRECGKRSDSCRVWVSQHFQYLAEQRQATDGLSAKAKERIKEFLTLQRATGSSLSVDCADDLLTLGTAWLRFFDHVSLFLCCRLPADPDRIISPDGTKVTIRQQPAKCGEISVHVPSCLNESATLRIRGREFRKHEATDWPAAELPPRTLSFRITGIDCPA